MTTFCTNRGKEFSGLSRARQHFSATASPTGPHQNHATSHCLPDCCSTIHTLHSRRASPGPRKPSAWWGAHCPVPWAACDRPGGERPDQDVGDADTE